jgi:hypothetical protein
MLGLHYCKSDLKVTVVGSGNWGTAVARRIALNLLDGPEYNASVNMWVFEEEVMSFEYVYIRMYLYSYSYMYAFMHLHNGVVILLLTVWLFLSLL